MTVKKHLARYMSQPAVRLSAAGLASMFVTIMLLLFMHYLMGGFNEATTKRVFNLYTVDITSSENNEAFKKPEKVLMQPELSGLESHVKEEAEALLSREATNPSMQMEPGTTLKIEIDQPAIENAAPRNQGETGRDAFISILEKAE